MTEDLLSYGLQLCKQGTIEHALDNFSKALLKYESASFVLSELTIELYHTLKFSNEDTQSSSNDDNVAHRRDKCQLGEFCGYRVKSFTFDTEGHRKLEFTRKDELMLSNVQKMLNQRIIECKE